MAQIPCLRGRWGLAVALFSLHRDGELPALTAFVLLCAAAAFAARDDRAVTRHASRSSSPASRIAVAAAAAPAGFSLVGLVGNRAPADAEAGAAAR